MKLLKDASTVNSLSPPHKLTLLLLNYLWRFILEFVLPIVVHFVLVDRQSDQSYSWLLFLSIGHHFLNVIWLNHLAVLIVDPLLFLLLLFVVNSVTMTLSDLLELGLLALNIVKRITDEWLWCDRIVLIFQNYCFEQMMVFVQIEIINRHRLFLFCNLKHDW